MTSHHTEQLHRLAHAINRMGLQTPARIVLNIVAPFDFLSSQVIQFVRPFAHGYRIEAYMAALASESSWPELRELLNQSDASET